jgi:large subunit ribosomal protein L23
MTKETTKKKTTAKKDKVFGNAYKVLVRPLATEKSTALVSQGKYFFEVSVDANKLEVAKSISEVYGVTPKSVNILNVEGKTVRRGRIKGKRKDWKKAVVTLKAGETINIYEGV